MYLVKRIFKGLIFLLLANSVYAENELKLNSSIEKVVVFRDKARISRKASGYVKAGITHIKIYGLSNNIAQNSLQVRGKGEAVIRGVSLNKNYLDEDKESSPEVRELKEKRKNLNFIKDSLQNFLEVLKHEEELFLANKKMGGEEGVNPDFVSYMAKLYRNRLMENKMSHTKINKKINKLNEKIENINNQLNEKENKDSSPSSVVTIIVSSNTATKINLKVNYLVYNAGWKPVYNIRASDFNNPIDLIFKAKVYQNTNVDWNNVQLTLSTRDPSYNAKVPELNKWYIDFYQKPQIMTSERQKSMMKKKKDISMSGKSATSKMKTTAGYVKRKNSVLATKYDITMPYTIPSGKKSRMVEVKNYNIKNVDYQYVTIPKKSPKTYLMAYISGWEKYDLLPGKANIYFEDAYVGKTQINPSSTKNKLNITLGIDENIVVKRELNKDYSISHTLGTHKKIEKGYDITIKNNKSRDIDIKVIDQIPLSRNNKIEVELKAKDNADFDKTTGKLKWDINISSQKQKKLSFKFKIKYPKNEKIEGL